MVLHSEMVVMMRDIGVIEANLRTLKKTVEYLPDGRVKETVERQIKQNIDCIDEFFDELAEEAKFIESYEQSNQ
jgi:chromatin remodeling complex protein RSC6